MNLLDFICALLCSFLVVTASLICEFRQLHYEFSKNFSNEQSLKYADCLSEKKKKKVCFDLLT